MGGHPHGPWTDAGSGRPERRYRNGLHPRRSRRRPTGQDLLDVPEPSADYGGLEVDIEGGTNAGGSGHWESR